MDPEVQIHFFSGPLLSTNAILFDYQLAMVGEYPTVANRPNRKVDGLLVELTSYQEKVADDWEGKDYSKKKLQVVCQSELIECFVYINPAEPSEWISRYTICEHSKKAALDHNKPLS